MQPYDKVQKLYTANNYQNAPLNCGDVVDAKIKRFDGYVINSTRYQKYEWLIALEYAYTTADGQAIPFGPLSGNYFVVTTPDNAPYLLAKSNNSKDSAVNIASYYPRGMLISADGYIYVTKTVCSVYTFRDNSVAYSSMYPWSPNVEAKKGLTYVYNGNIYYCKKSSYSEIPYIGSEYYTLLQEAPATRFDAVIPLVFLDSAYGSTAPVGTLIANGNGTRLDYSGNLLRSISRSGGGCRALTRRRMNRSRRRPSGRSRHTGLRQNWADRWWSKRELPPLWAAASRRQRTRIRAACIRHPKPITAFYITCGSCTRNRMKEGQNENQ